MLNAAFLNLFATRCLLVTVGLPLNLHPELLSASLLDVTNLQMGLEAPGPETMKSRKTWAVGFIQQPGPRRVSGDTVEMSRCNSLTCVSRNP